MKGHRLHTASKKRREVYIKKILICFMSVMIIACLSIGLGSNFAAAHDDTSEEPVEQKYYKSIELEYGDTLWDIAEEYMDDNYDSIYEYIDELKAINGLESDNIQESRYLTVAYYSEFR